MTKTEAKTIVATLAKAYPASPVNTEHGEIWAASLEPFPYAHVAEAARKLLLTSKWFPALSELLAETVRVTDGLPDPEAAWLAALRWQRDGFPLEAKPHAAVMDAIRASGGTHSMKTAPAHEWKRMFDAAYTGIHQRAFQRMLEETLPAIEAETRKALKAGMGQLPAGLLPKTASVAS